MIRKNHRVILLAIGVLFAFILSAGTPAIAKDKKEVSKDTVEQVKKKAKKSTEKAKAALSKKLNINKAGKEDLMLLPGIGEAKAKAIIKARKKKPFTNLKDVMERKIGVGEKIIEEIKPYLKFK